MDLVIGCSLADMLRESGTQGRVLPVPMVAAIIAQAARGLGDAHDACSPLGEPLQIVHRDVSPQNILVGVDGATRITDFGVAHAMKRMTKTVGRNIKGKIAYCSPEQARAEPLDGRSDLFALGIVMWEALTMRRLFRHETTADTVRAVLNEPIQDPRFVRSDIPPALAAVVMKALQRDRDARYATGLEMASDIRAAIALPSVADVRGFVRLIAGAQIDRLVTDIQQAAARPEFDGAVAVPEAHERAPVQEPTRDLRDRRPSAAPLGAAPVSAPPVSAPPIAAPAQASGPSPVAPRARVPSTAPMAGPMAPPRPSSPAWVGPPANAPSPPTSETVSKGMVWPWILLFCLVVGGMVVMWFVGFSARSGAEAPASPAPAAAPLPSAIPSGAPSGVMPSGQPIAPVQGTAFPSPAPSQPSGSAPQPVGQAVGGQQPAPAEVNNPWGSAPAGTASEQAPSGVLNPWAMDGLPTQMLETSMNSTRNSRSTSSRPRRRNRSPMPPTPVAPAEEPLEAPILR